MTTGRTPSVFRVPFSVFRAVAERVSVWPSHQGPRTKRRRRSATWKKRRTENPSTPFALPEAIDCVDQDEARADEDGQEQTCLKVAAV